MIQIREVNKLEELLELEEEWNKLFDRSSNKNIFLSHSWIKTWWKNFGSDKKMLILFAYAGEKLVGIAPLMITSKRIIRFIGHPIADYGDFVLSNNESEVLFSFFDYLNKKNDLWSSIQLDEIPEESTTIKTSKEVLKKTNKYNSISFCNERLSVDFKGDVEKLQSLLRKKSLRRYVNRLDKLGKLEFKRLTKKEEIDEILSIFFEQHKEIWNRRHSRSMFYDNRCKTFFREITKDLLLFNAVDVLVLYLNKKPIAIQYGFNWNQKHANYCQSYDLEFYDYSPGNILIKLYVEYFQEKEFREVDFTRGVEPYKYRFSNKHLYNYSITIHKNLFNYTTNRSYNTVKERIMKNHKLHNKISKYRNKVNYKLKTIKI